MPVTKDDMLAVAKDAKAALDVAVTLEDVKTIFNVSYGTVGWKALCRLWVLGQTPEQAVRYGGNSKE